MKPEPRLFAGPPTPGAAASAASLSGSEATGGSGVAVGRSAPRLPDYELLRCIGQGAYGEVWLARGLTGVLRAVKIVWRDRFPEAEPFEREFRGVRESIAHSLEAGQLALLHVGQNESAGFFYYVMELADDATTGGRATDPARYVPLTLKEHKARRSRLPAVECLELAVELVRPLAALHRRGLVHRDIKPSNVILVNGVPKLADVGLVAAASEARTFVGTQGYLPPEGPGTPAADVYALGKVLYELATGFDCDEFPRLPAEFKDAADRKALFELNEILLRACEPSPDKRYRDASALLADLLSLRAGRSPRGRRIRATVLRAAAALVVIGAGAVIGRQKFSRSESLVPPSAAPLIPPATVAAREKSLVVLPFENLSPDPQNAYFTAGLHAEVIAALSRLPDLHVMSRATSEAFKDGKTPLAEIGRRLGVADVLTGSVQRDGQDVRVQLELRQTRNEALLWQRTFERKLQPGFALQDEIVTEIARILQARGDVGSYSGARFMTKNPQAYELFLKARELPYQKSWFLKETWEEQVRLCEEALKLDPDFMSGASLASSAYCQLLVWTETNRQQLVDRAKYWADHASQLVPGGAGDGALAVYYSMVEDDQVRALAYARNEVRALPNDSNGYNRVGAGLMSFGRFTEAVAAFDHALALDPLNYRVLANRVEPYARLRWLPEFEAAAARSIEFGGKYVNLSEIVEDRTYLTDRLPADLDAVRKLGPARRLNLLLMARQYDEVLTTAAEIMKTAPAYKLYCLGARAVALEELGRSEERVAVGTEMLAMPSPPEMDDPTARASRHRWTILRLWAMALANQGDEAVHAARRQLELDRAPGRTAERFRDEEQLARVYAWSGRPKECIELLAKLLREPSLVTVGYLKLHPVWDKVRDEPAFQALLADPKNSARLDDNGPIAPAPGMIEVAPPASAPVSVPVSAPVAAADKSIVVLPLENLSPDPDDAYFAGGMHAEIIATLARLPDLRVISRTTAERFKTTALPEIGEKLGVGNVLTGSVRHGGRSIRIELELRRAKDEAVLWQKTFDRELQNGFDLQDEVAADVAKILQARGSAGSAAKFMTRNPEAYLLFLKARALPFLKGPTKATFEEQARLAEEALRLDPEFVSAAILLSTAYSYWTQGSLAPAERTDLAARAKKWGERASELAPGGAGDGALAVYYSMVSLDGARALAYAKNEARALPNDADAHNRLACAYADQGLLHEACAEVERALALDPMHVRALNNRVNFTGFLRNGPEFERAVAQNLTLGGKNVDRATIADLRYRITGSLPPTFDNLEGYLPGRIIMLEYARRFDEVVAEIDAALAKNSEPGADRKMFYLRMKGVALHHLGRPDALAALARETAAYADTLSPTDDGPWVNHDLARMLAFTFAGQAEEAIAAGRRYVESAGPPRPVSSRWGAQNRLAQVYAWFGRKKECIELLAELITKPSFITVPYLRLAPEWDNVRDDPAFQALLADPQNSASL